MLFCWIVYSVKPNCKSNYATINDDYYNLLCAVPRITIYNITVLESVGTVQIPINRTGGDLSRGSVICAKSRDVPGQAVGEYYWSSSTVEEDD